MAKILLVDDAAFMRMRASKMLAEAGHEVVEAANGKEAVEAYAAESPDCVLMDITMSEMDGIAALKEIRDQDPNAKVSMVTAMGQQSIILEALKSGAADFVVKPFEKERVLAAIERMLG